MVPAENAQHKNHLAVIIVLAVLLALSSAFATYEYLQNTSANSPSFSPHFITLLNATQFNNATRVGPWTLEQSQENSSSSIGIWQFEFLTTGVSLGLFASVQVHIYNISSYSNFEYQNLQQAPANIYKYNASGTIGTNGVYKILGVCDSSGKTCSTLIGFELKSPYVVSVEFTALNPSLPLSSSNSSLILKLIQAQDSQLS